jgi:hypothetical protein
VLQKTLRSIERSDWPASQLFLEVDQSTDHDPYQSQAINAAKLLKKFLRRKEEFLLFLEDDVEVNQHLCANLECWLQQNSAIHLGSLYNPGYLLLWREGITGIVEPSSFFGSQALLISRKAAAYLMRRWNGVEGMQDLRIRQLAELAEIPIYLHIPSLVQHRSEKSTWGGRFHQARDFVPLFAPTEPKILNQLSTHQLRRSHSSVSSFRRSRSRVEIPAGSNR